MDENLYYPGAVKGRFPKLANEYITGINAARVMKDLWFEQRIERLWAIKNARKKTGELSLPGKFNAI